MICWLVWLEQISPVVFARCIRQSGLRACWRNPVLPQDNASWKGRVGHLEGRNDNHLAGNYWFAKLLWGGWWWVSTELLQRLLGISAGALTLLLLFLSLAACHQRGHGTPNRYSGGGTGDACVLRVMQDGSMTITLLPPGSNHFLSFFSLPQWWSPWSLVKERRPMSMGNL